MALWEALALAEIGDGKDVYLGGGNVYLR